MRLTREVALAAPAAEAWWALATLPPARGSAAGYEGTAVLVDADDEARTATLRLQGAAGPATVAVTAIVTVLDAKLAITALLLAGPGGVPVEEATAEDALGHLSTTLAYALVTAGRPATAWDKAVPPSPAPVPAWDTPSPPPARPLREKIGESAKLRPATALVATGPAEVLTPRPRDVTVPGRPTPEPAEHRWVRVGVAAAAALAAAGILRSRR